MTPKSRQPPKTSTSAPPFTEPNRLKERQPVTPTTQSDSSSLTTETARFGDFDGSFRTHRPTYKLPQHVKTRAESFRLHRPKDFIKQTSEVPGDRAILNPLSKDSNLTSLSPNLDQSFTHFPTDILQTSESSLKRSESCKENRSSQNPFPFIPVVQGNKRRSKGILSRVLSVKINSEKVHQHLQTRQTLPISTPCTDGNSVSEKSSLVEEKSSFPSNTYLETVTSLSASDIDSASKHEKVEEIVKETAELGEHEKVEEIAEETAELGEHEKVEVIVEETAELGEHEKVEEIVKETAELGEHEKVEVVVKETAELGEDEKVEEIVEETVESTKHEKVEEIVKEITELKPDPAETRLVVYDRQISNELHIKTASQVETLTTSPTSSRVDRLDTEVSLLLIKIVDEVVANFDCETSKLYIPEHNLIESIAKSSSPLHCSVASSLAQIPFKTIVDGDIRGSVSQSQDTPSPELIVDQFLEDNNGTFDSSFSDSCESDLEGGMEGRHSLRSRRVAGVGSVKSRIIATENRNGNAGSDVKKERRVLESRVLRNVEGVRSRMNKFTVMAAATSTSAKTNSFKKKESTPEPDANNNLNGKVPVPRKEKSMKELQRTSVKCSEDVQSIAVCDKAAELEVYKKRDNMTPTVPDDAVAVKAEPLPNSNSNPTTPSVVEINGKISPLNGSKENIIDSGTVDMKLQNVPSRDDKAPKHNTVDEVRFYRNKIFSLLR